ncbi:unnamed protein product [Effrenium voratum]|uniref:Uncharacterized protein n=1 Tax=Effrenium voratum TaxID=2562239 RepID=A0AA36IZ53_9DINO|nr:unnamed protein product [Effrenium voratum]
MGRPAPAPAPEAPAPAPGPTPGLRPPVYPAYPIYPTYLPPDSKPEPEDVHSLMPDLISPAKAETTDRYGTLRDPFSDLLQPETMQPIYLLPVMNGLKQLFTFFVFGFDVKFKPKDSSKMTKILKLIVSSVVKVAFIAFAINAMHQDFERFGRRHQVEEGSKYNEVLTLMAVWCTSPNFAAGLGLWGQLSIQSPGAVFKDDIEDANYRTLWSPFGYKHIKFPLCLAGSSWLAVMKQIYALVLLPYVIPAMALEFLTSILFCYWVIFESRMLCLIKCLQVHVVTLLAAAVWLLSLGHFGSNGFAKYWTSLWPFVYMYMVYIFASFFVPVFMAILYGILTGAPLAQISKGIGCMQDSTRDDPGRVHTFARKVRKVFCDDDGDGAGFCGRCFTYLEAVYARVMPHRELQLEEDDRGLLLRLDSHKLMHDFTFKRGSSATSTSTAIERIRRELLKLRAKYQGEHSESDSEDMVFQQGEFTWWQALVGDETCNDGDVNLRKDPQLEDDLNSKETSLDDAEVQIVMLTIRAMAEVAIIQALVIFLVRTLKGNSFSDFVNAMHITIQERHIRDYINHLMTIGEEKIGKIFNAVWTLI